MTASEIRRGKLRRLAQGCFDLLVIGGGINGAGIAREAALRGLRTALVEKGDFASGTSSRSSKLVHGGFRYLENGDFGLVLEASRERDLLRRLLAPHLVTPIRFLFPIYRGGPLPLWKLRVGLLLYDLLAAFRNIERHRAVGASRVAVIEPRLRADGIVGGALYYDCFTDDARLVLENVLGAEQAGAICLNYVAVESFERDPGGMLDAAVVRDHGDEGGTMRVRALAIVNAAGPWLDRVRALDDPRAPAVLRPTKGVHVVVPWDRVGNRHAIVVNAVRDRRVMFVIPWEEHTIVGTTDTDFDGPPDAVTADDSDVEYLLETLNFHFPQARLEPDDVVSTFAGLRPLVAGAHPEAPSEVSREDMLFESRSGLLSLGGGKLTTYRRIAVKVVDRIARRLRERFGMEVRRRSGTSTIPLPGGVGFVPSSASIGDGLGASLWARYGTRASAVSSLAFAVPELAERIVPEAPNVRAEVVFAAATEMAQTVEDVLRRRTAVALKAPDGGVSAATLAAGLMAKSLGWNRTTEERRAREYAEDLRPALRSRLQA
jgi:glycerol-3-phosphate dehydrogenase